MYDRIESFSDGPIMVGGCGSSGTTLLAQLLNAHPSITCGPELYLLNKKILYSTPSLFNSYSFRDLVRTGVPTTGELNQEYLATSTYSTYQFDYTFLRNLYKYDIKPAELYDLADNSNCFHEFVDLFFAKVLERIGKVRWAEKTPTNCYCIGEFLSMYPTGRYLHLVRDGRDVVLSLIKRSISPEMAIRRWIHDTATGIPHRTNSRYYEIRYEDLVRSPKSTLSGVLNFLGEFDAVEEMLTQARQNPVLETTHASWRSQPNEEIWPTSVGKWRRQFSGRDQAYLKQLFSHIRLSKTVSQTWQIDQINGNDLLHLFDYEIGDSWTIPEPVSYRMTKHYITERFFQVLRFKRPTYFRIALDQP